MVMMLRQCCCGCTLKTGAIIIGVIDIFFALGHLSIGIEFAVAGPFVHGPLGAAFIGVGVVLAVLGAIMLAFCICLIIGADKGNPTLLVPWMVYTIVYMILNTILTAALAALLIASVFLTVFGILLIVELIIHFLLQTYFLLVVYSLYRELKGTAPPSNFA